MCFDMAFPNGECMMNVFFFCVVWALSLADTRVQHSFRVLSLMHTFHESMFYSTAFLAGSTCSSLPSIVQISRCMNKSMHEPYAVVCCLGNRCFNCIRYIGNVPTFQNKLLTKGQSCIGEESELVGHWVKCQQASFNDYLLYMPMRSALR